MKIFKKIFIKIFILTFWIGVWELLALSVGQELYLPSPITVAKRLATLILEGAYWSTVLSTIWRIFYGIIIATILGIILVLTQQYFGIIKINSGYMAQVYPVELQLFDVIAVVIVVLLMGFLSALFTVKKQIK